MQLITTEEKKIIDQYSNINSSNFKTQILSIIKNWKIDVNRNYDFIVNNEAFNWKRLAVYIIDNLKLDKEMYNLAINWITKPHLFATLSENNFKNLIGFEKYTSHLSYLYGLCFLIPSNNGSIDFVVDGFGANKDSPLLYINDGRN